MNMKESVRVECYAGYKADEEPKSIYWKDKKYEIKEIPDRWYQGNVNPEWPAANYYKVLTMTHEIFILKQEVEQDEWYLMEMQSINKE